MMKKLLVPLSIALCTTAAAQDVLAQDPLANFSINLRTFYFNRDFSGDTESREAFTQAVRVDYEKEFLGSLKIGASLFANARIMDDGDAHLTGLLDPEDEGGYAKLGQIYAEYSFENMVTIKGGRWVMDTALLNDSDSRATPSSTQAVQITGKYKGSELYFIYSDRASSKTDSEFNRYTDANGDKYEIVMVGGETQLDNGLSFAAAYGDADGYSQQLYLRGGYTMNENFAFEVTHYTGEGEGAHSAFDADLTNIVASYSRDNLKLSAGFQTVTGDSGYDYGWGGDDDNGLLTSNSVQILDFNNEDEDSWQLRVDYEFSAFPNLAMMARHTMGEYTDGGEDVDEAETNFELNYKITSTFLDGLNLRLRYSYIEADAYEDINEIRLIANYSF